MQWFEALNMCMWWCGVIGNVVRLAANVGDSTIWDIAVVIGGQMQIYVSGYTVLYEASENTMFSKVGDGITNSLGCAPLHHCVLGPHASSYLSWFAAGPRGRHRLKEDGGLLRSGRRALSSSKCRRWGRRRQACLHQNHSGRRYASLLEAAVCTRCPAWPGERHKFEPFLTLQEFNKCVSGRTKLPRGRRS